MSELIKPTKTVLATAIATALGSTSAMAQDASNEIFEEITVTATKRQANMQDIPVSVQAMSGESLKELGVETFDQYVEYLPNVVSAGNGPGKKEIYIRGSATEQVTVSVGPAQGTQPGVALYVDEQPVSFGARNLDYYAADLERIEVLSGPQGTLFGASSQSGNMRLITNKPRQGIMEAGFNAKYGVTDGGSDSAAVDAYINIPITDNFAARVVVYSDSQGGWIDNIPASFTPSGTVVDRNSLGFGPPLTGADSVETAFNDHLVADDWNEAVYRGGRFSFLYDINDEWDLLLQHTAQSLEVQGTFLSDPSLGEANSAHFSPDFNSDSFGLTTWTLNGRIANLDLVYTGGYLDREVDSIIDYTFYNNGGGYITYYLCSGNVYDATDVNNCYNPTKQYLEDTDNTRTTHEFRVSSDAENRFRFIAGVYYNDQEATHVGDFQYFSTNPAFAEHVGSYYNDPTLSEGYLVGNITVPTAGVVTSGPRGPLTTFFNDFTRTEEELAFFGQLQFDLTDSVTVSVGARYYDLDSQLQGASNFAFGCRYGVPPQGFGNSELTSDGRCNSHAFSNDVTARMLTLGQYVATGDDNIILDARAPNGVRDMFRGGGGTGTNALLLADIQSGAIDLSLIEPDGSTNESDTIVKASIDWRPTDDALIFASYSEGYRPATQNRNAGRLAANLTGVYANYRVPVVAKTDTLTNYEIGFKGDLLGQRMRLNTTLYRSDIEDLQLSRFDPSNVAFLYFIENVGDAEITGLDAELQWATTDNLTLVGSLSWLDTEITRLNPQLDGVAVPVGSELPLAAEISGNLRARYDFPLDAMNADGYVSLGINYRGETVSAMVGTAEFFEDNLVLQTGVGSGLGIQHEGGTFGTVMIDDGAGGLRLPSNSRFINPAATTVNAAFGLQKDAWGAELFFTNLTNEEAPIVQVVGKFTPEVSTQRPRTIGVRFNFYYE